MRTTMAMLAALGWIGGIAWHITARLGRTTGMSLGGVLLFIGVFVVWFPAVFSIILPGPPAHRRRSSARSVRGIVGVAAVSVISAFINAALLPPRPPVGMPDPRFVLAASVHVSAFYAMAAAILWVRR